MYLFTKQINGMEANNISTKIGNDDCWAVSPILLKQSRNTLRKGM